MSTHLLFRSLSLRNFTRAQQRPWARHYHQSCATRSQVSADMPPVTATNRAQVTARRFWKTVGIEERPDSFLVTLDKRPLKTPEGAVLAIPRSKRLLATLIAHEWENQETLIKPYALPMTSLASRAIDSFQKQSTRVATREALLDYFDTDTICFFTDHPPTLVSLQQRHWLPLLLWAEEEFKIEIRRFDSLMVTPQSTEAKEAIRNALDGMDAWKLAAMERAAYAAKSIIIALALIRGKVSVEEAAQAAHVEVTSQIQKWGEVEDTHDVDFHEIRRQLGSAACLLVDL
ncbi:ATP12-domain-containing protein [Hysterangium stoloniferum]|nr:ATP12-domain-containing protein [Hysterangium stoloniferum]